ncbi:MAG: hypothetical protein QOG70_3444 [Solirubrobacteraceae bacterium]|nr:hypothetical protein [Solirubrobacteraceae bacterium]
MTHVGLVRVLMATALVGLAGAGSARAAVPFKTISSAGPLTSVSIGNEGGCQVGYSGDARLELFPSSTTPGDCGTLIFTGATLYAPDFANHGGSAASSIGASTPFTPISQTEVAGAGTAASPFTVTTVYDAGATGLRVTEVNSYVAGQEYYRTDVTIQNSAGAAQSGVVYRAGDCYLQDADTGFGFVEAANGGPGCARNANNTPAGRIEQWVPLTAGSSYMEDRYSAVWAAIAAHVPFPNTCMCDTAVDNGAGISWSFNVAPGASAQFSHLTVFSPTGITGAQQQQPQPTTQVPRVTGSQALSLPSNRTCTSRRAFPIKVRQISGVRYSFAIVAVNSRRVPVYVYTTRRIKVTRIGAVYLNRKRFRSFVDLRGLARGTYRVRVTAVTTDGQVLVATRKYRTCSSRLTGTIPRL